MVMSPQVSWLFFRAVRAGLAVKRPYLSHTGRASNAEKQPTGRGPEGCVENGPGKRVGGSAYWRIGVWGSKTAFRHGYNNQEVSTDLTMLCKRRHAETPIR